MIIYNVTIKVNQSIAGDLLAWLKEEHIPEIIKTGCFTNATILRLLEIDDTDGPTYAVQYHAENEALYKMYIEKFSAEMRKKGTDKWGNQFIAFRTVMEVVH
jgi:prophage antirepressor-like protein